MNQPTSVEIQFIQGDNITVALDLSYPILISVDEHTEGGDKPVFEQFLGMPHCTSKKSISDVELETMSLFIL